MTALITALLSTLTRLTSNVQRYFYGHIPEYKKYKLQPPSVPHLILDESKIKGRKLLFIGDVHGCLDELNELIDEVKNRFDQTQYLPIFVGDIINKGPKNIETLHKVQEIEHFSVRGNHDEAVLRQFLLSKEKCDYDLPIKYEWVKELNEDDINYLRELPYTISIPRFNAIVVHAGLVPNIALTNQRTVDMIIMRNVVKSEENKYHPEEGLGNGQAWASVWPGPEHVYFGHDARRKLQLYPYATGLDTGCVYGFELTAVLVSQDGKKEFIKIQAKDVYEKPSG